MRLGFLIPLAMLAASCSPPAAPRDDIYLSIKKCGLDGQIRVKMEGDHRGYVSYLSPNADYAKVYCFVTEAKRLHLSLGFVGNEAPSTQ